MVKINASGYYHLWISILLPPYINYKTFSMLLNLSLLLLLYLYNESKLCDIGFLGFNFLTYFY